MDGKKFNELIKAVREAGKVQCGEKRASRVFKYSSVEVKKLRECQCESEGLYRQDK